MHELSIASAIADVAIRHAGGRRVRRVEVRIGAMRQVVPRALAFAWQMVGRETPLEEAELVLAVVPAHGRCRGCGADGRLAGFPLVCAGCGGFDLEILAGQELLVEALDLEDPAPAAAAAPADDNVIHRENWPTAANGRRTA